MSNIVLENEQFILTLREDCITESLILKKTGEELLMTGEEISLFSLTEPRPFNNEIKLAHPNKRTTFEANRVRLEGNRLIVGFEVLLFEAVVEVNIQPGFIAFTLVDYIIHEGDFGHLCMTPPPVLEFRLIQLPIKDRGRFGEWLNVSWNQSACVNVLAADMYPRIDSERRKGYHVMYADALRDIRLKNTTAALIASPYDDYLDTLEQFEIYFGLPNGVKSRRRERRSVFWIADMTPKNVDEYIDYAKKAGIQRITLYFPSFFKAAGYSYCGDYDYRPEYPNGAADLKVMLDKLKANGISPGFHFLHSHVGLKSRYCTPICDHRLRLTRHFTLAKGIGTEDTEIYVEQNPLGAEMHDLRRVLNFGGELISYEGYTTEYPYYFYGCKRGHNKTIVRSHDRGLIGGVLDISEYCGVSCYVDQDSDLQDEINDKLVEAYDAGFEYVYFDGAEGVNEPYEIYVPLAQYRFFKKCAIPPLSCGGAARGHFSWHMFASGNGFDVFPNNIFKAMIDEHPVKAADRSLSDFSYLSFGGWAFRIDTMPDLYEYGLSRGAAWDCGASMRPTPYIIKANPRSGDILEVVRRWEDARFSGFITEERKQMMKSSQEHILLINEKGEYELEPYDKIDGTPEDISAFTFSRAGKNYVTLWHTKGTGRIKLPIEGDVVYEKELGGERLEAEKTDGGIVIEVSNRYYLSSETLTKDELAAAFAGAEVIE